MAGWTQPACRRLGDMSNALLCRVPSPAPAHTTCARRVSRGEGRRRGTASRWHARAPGRKSRVLAIINRWPGAVSVVHCSIVVIRPAV